MNTLDHMDDPVIPNDISALVRRASRGLDVAPAALPAVQQRARQRRRRRQGLVAGGAAAVMLLGALVVAQVVTGSDDSQRIITATTGSPELTGTVPQPLLLWGGTPASPNWDDEGERPDGSWLDEITPAGARHWWRSDPGREAVQGVVLPDGRRFGLSLDQGRREDEASAYSLDEIGRDGRTASSTDLVAAEPDPDASLEFSIVGTSGSEVILERRTDTVHEPTADGGYTFQVESRLVARDVDTGAERVLHESTGTTTAAAAGDRLVIAPGTDCDLQVGSLAGGGDLRTLEGGCPPGVDDLTGLADSLAVSPDGRYAAVVWRMVRLAGPGESMLAVIDLDSGALVGSADLSDRWPATKIGFTGDRQLTMAIDPDAPELPAVIGGIDVVSAPYRVG